MHQLKLRKRIGYFFQNLRHTWNDQLTGTYSRGFVLQLGEHELNRFKRYQRPFSLILIDLDKFKSINDAHGHLCGDIVLKGVADFLKNNLRTTDMLGRYGGEEFILLLPETSFADAMQLMTRLVNKLAETEIASECCSLHVTMSAGVAAPSKDLTTLSQLFKKADEALYRAKNSGRNRVCGANDFL